VPLGVLLVATYLSLHRYYTLHLTMMTLALGTGLDGTNELYG
jgi:hypothetical protein